MKHAGVCFMYQTIHLPRFLLKQKFTTSSLLCSILSHWVTGFQESLQPFISNTLLNNYPDNCVNWHGDTLPKHRLSTFSLFLFFSLSYFLTLDLVSPSWSPLLSLSCSRLAFSSAWASVFSEKIESMLHALVDFEPSRLFRHVTSMWLYIITKFGLVFNLCSSDSF